MKFEMVKYEDKVFFSLDIDKVARYNKFELNTN